MEVQRNTDGDTPSTSDTEAAFLDLNLSIHNDIVSTKIYDKPPCRRCAVGFC